MTLKVRMGNCCLTNVPTANPFNSPFSHHNSCCQVSKAGRGQRDQPLLSAILRMDGGHLVQELHMATAHLVLVAQPRGQSTPSQGRSRIFLAALPGLACVTIAMGAQQRGLQRDTAAD